MSPLVIRIGRHGCLFLAGFILLLGCARTMTQSPNKAEASPSSSPESDVWILAGQSNMVGAELVPPTGDPVKPDPQITMYNMSNEWMVARDPLHRLYDSVAPVHRELCMLPFTKEAERKQFMKEFEAAREVSRKTPLGGYGPGLSFAREVHQATGRPIGLIPCAHGGTSMDWWDPAKKNEGDHSLYGALLGRIRTSGANVKGVLWYQGESDSQGELPKAYKQKMLNLVDALRRDTGKPDLPIIIVQIGRYFYPDKSFVPGWEEIRELQRELPYLRKNLYMVSANDLPMCDMIHLSAEGQRRLGHRLAEAALTCVYKKPGHGQPIDLAGVQVLDRTGAKASIRLRFSGISGRLKAPGQPSGQFELRSAQTFLNGWPTVIYHVELDPDDPAGVILRLATGLNVPAKLVCGAGLEPYMNIVDDKDMAIPAFTVDLPNK